MVGHDQGALHGAWSSASSPRSKAWRSRARPNRSAASHLLGGEIDLHGHRARRLLRHVLRRDQLLRQPGHANPCSRQRAERVRRSPRSWMTSPRACDVLERARLAVGSADARSSRTLDLDVHRGEILGFVGASGQGQIGADAHHPRPRAEARGTIEVFGQDVDELDHAERRAWSSALGRAVPAGRACSRR